MVQLSTKQVAGELNEAFGLTSITAEKVLELVKTGVFTDVGPGRSVRVEMSEFQGFTQRTRYVTRSQWPAGYELYRVSLIHLRPDPAWDSLTDTMRSHAGVDYSGRLLPLSSTQRELAWTGVWEVADETADAAVRQGAVLFGTTKGYIDPRYFRVVTGYRRTVDGSQLWWTTAPAPAAIAQFVGTGLWMDVKPGRESDWA